MGFWSGFADGLAQALNGERSYGRIDRLCEQLRWGIDDRKGDRITLNFNCPVVGTRPVFIRGGDEPLVSFTAYSLAILREDEIPEELCGILLVRNAQLGVGKWQLEEGSNHEGYFCLSYMALGSGLDAAGLKYICEKMAVEASNFDGRMKRAGKLR